MKPNGVFIAATGQNVGKTTLCLGIMAALKKRFSTVGFLKPVGQQYVKTEGNDFVDKDVLLFKNYFELNHLASDMSPVILPSGFTKDFLDGKVNEKKLEQTILSSFKTISSTCSFTLVEGTGHVGVGSLVCLNNAKVARLLNLEIVLIASGGLGSAYDELALNIALCQTYGVKIKGIILNRVLNEKREMIEDYFPKALKKLDIPLLGCIPYSEFLSLPSLQDFASLFQTKLLAGKLHATAHFPHHRLVAGSLSSYEEEILHPGELIITPATREDIILATLKKHKEAEKFTPTVHALILTSTQPPSAFIIEEIKKADFPALYAPLCSYDAMKLITSFIAKIRNEDIEKIEQAIQLVENHINFNPLLLS